jgi:hypothetical protein
MGEKAPSMIHVLALSRSEPARVVRARCKAGSASPTSIGGGENDRVRLAGAVPSAAELVVLNRKWHVRLAGGAPDEVTDGMRASIDGWNVYLFTDDSRDEKVGAQNDTDRLDEALASLACEADRPRLEFGDRSRVLLEAVGPVLLANLPDSDHPLPGAGAGCAIAIRRAGSGGTFLYSIVASYVSRNGVRAPRRSRLADRDRVEVALDAGRAVFVFRDPLEELDGLLGALRGEAPPPEPPRSHPEDAWWQSAAHSARVRLPTLPVTAWEAGLWAAGASVTMGFALLFLTRC